MNAPAQAITFKPRQSEKNIGSFRRENSFRRQISLIDPDKGRDVATVRFYGNGSFVYCVAWFHFRDYGDLGEGVSEIDPDMDKAGGYGYHRFSAAMGAAFDDAGVRLHVRIHGAGDEAMRDALLALAKHVGIARPYVHVSHP